VQISSRRRGTVWLSLAAALTFAVMALLTEAYGGGPADILCSAAPGGVPFSGHDGDVPADERLPLGAVAEAGIQTRGMVKERLTFASASGPPHHQQGLDTSRPQPARNRATFG
jgi:hypothetical protein